MANKTLCFLLFVCSGLKWLRADNDLNNAIICLAKILNRYRELANCPWDILTTCSAEHLLCRKENLECSLYQHQNVSVYFNVYLSSLHIIEEQEVIESDWCGCKVIFFNCNITTGDLIESERTLENTTTTIAKLTEDNSSEKEDDSVSVMLGAAFGGATFSMVISFLVCFLIKRRKKFENTEKITGNFVTQSSIYESASGMIPFEYNPISRRSSNIHVYNTVVDSSPDSHVIPKVIYNLDPTAHMVNNDNTYLVLTGEDDANINAEQSHL